MIRDINPILNSKMRRGNWLWFLSMDCDGNTASSSTETGHPSALDWVWAWDWEWACNSPPRPPPLEPLAAGNDTESTSPSTDTAGGPPTQPASVDGDGAAGEPWLWTWTFTFCGQTTSATIPLYVQTQLQWDWDWTWDWTCEETAPDASPSPSTGTPAPPDAPSSETIPGFDQSASVPIPLAMAHVQVPVWVISLSPLSASWRHSRRCPSSSSSRCPHSCSLTWFRGRAEGLAGGFATTDAIVISPYARTRERAATAGTSAMRDATRRGRALAGRTWHVHSCGRGRSAYEEGALRRPTLEASSALATESPAPLPERRRSRELLEQLRARRLELGHGSARLFPRFLRPRTRAANTCNAGAEPARHVRIIHRSPWLSELSSRTRPCC